MSTETFKTELNQRAAVRARMLTRRSRVAAVTVALGALLVLGVIDFFSEAGTGPRLLLTLLALAAVVSLVLRLRNSRVPQPVDELVDSTEAQADDTTLALRTAADDFARDATARAEVGAELLERLDAHAAGMLNDNPLPLRAELRRWQIGLTAVLTVTVLFVALGGWLSYLRLALPGANLTYTQVRLAKLPERLAKSATIEVSGQVTGRKAAEVTVRLAALGQAQTASVAADGSFRVAVPNVSGPTALQAFAGDGQSDRYQIDPYDLPSVTKYHIEVSPPAYAQRLKKTVDEPSFDVLEGSSIRYTIETLEQPVEAVFAVAGGEENAAENLPFAAGATNRFELRLPLLAESIEYGLRLTGRHGDIALDPEPHRILVLPDEPPTIRILSHTGDEFELRKPVQFQLRGTDDVGIDSLKLLYRKIGETPEEQPVEFAELEAHEFTAGATLDLSGLDLKPYDIVAVHAEARDGNVLSGPGIGESEVILIEVPPPPGDDGSQGGGGGGGGGNEERVNPLEMQKHILTDTSRLPHDPPAKDRIPIRAEQLEALGYVEQLREQADTVTTDFVAIQFSLELRMAASAMKLSARHLQPYDRKQALTAQELAIAALTRAAALIPEDQQMPGQSEDAGQDGQPKITLKESSSSSSSESENSEERMKELLAQIEQLIAEQEALNEELAAAEEGSETASDPSAEAQAQLGQRSSQAAQTAAGLPIPTGAQGGAEALSGLLEEAGNLLGQASGEIEEQALGQALQLGTEGEGTLTDAAELLRAALGQADRILSEANELPAGYAPLIENYLRAISYEE